MHIAVLCDPASFHTRKWSQALQRNGAQVTVFSFSGAKVEGVKCVQIKPRFTRNGRLTYASFLYTTKALKEALEVHQVDVLNPINITPYGVWAARSSFRPIAAVAMGADILEYPPAIKDLPKAAWTNAEAPGLLGKALNRFKYHFFRHHVQRALNAAAYITGDNLVLTQAVQDYFDIPSDRITLNRWGVETDLFHPSEERLEKLRQKYGISPGQPVVLSPRGMKPVYQGGIILEAFEQMLKRGSTAKYLMFSAGYEVPIQVKKQAEAMMSLYPNFHFQEAVILRREVIELWSLVDVFISAPLYDGYSNAVAEGRYAGAIPLVNAIPGNREILEHGETGWFVEPFDPPNLVAALEEMLSHLPTYKTQFHEKSLPWILEHSVLDRNIQRFLRGVEDCLH